MKQYVYKMQWLFPINGNALQTKSQGRKNINSFIDIVNAKSFTVVYFRDCDLKIVDSYTNMVMYNTEKEANKKLKDLVKSIYDKADIQYIEFVRIHTLEIQVQELKDGHREPDEITQKLLRDDKI